jgi:cold shock CspA family protein
MEFVIVELENEDTSTPPESLQLKSRVDLVPTNTRKVSLNEAESSVICVAVDAQGAFIVPIVQVAGTPPACPANSAPFAPKEALLGTVTVDGLGNVTGGNPLLWMDAITETPLVGDTETWEIWNFTVDAHPIHLHLVAFQVVNREAFDPFTFALSGSPRAPEPWESGEKDTVIVYPGEVARIRAKFDIAGLYVWHCHIVEHEDNEMMRAYRVRKRPGIDFDGDGKTDIAVYHFASGIWFIKPSSGVADYYLGYGSLDYKPVPGDYDGDGKTDVAVYHSASGLWFIKPSSGAADYSVAYGSSDYKPVPGDYDGDGKTDIAVYHSPSGLWYIKPSAGAPEYYVGYGGTDYKPVPGDYDGDGKTDVAVYHSPSGLWFIKPSSGAADYYIGYGSPDYSPVPGDYDGDGKTDIAVYHSASGLWFIKPSSGAADYLVLYGGPDYTPVNSDYLHGYVY